MRCPHCGSMRAVLVEIMTNVNRYRCVKCRQAYTEPNNHGGDWEKNPSGGPSEKAYYFYRHQGKEAAFERALAMKGYWRTDLRRARLVFTDVDTPGRVAQMQKELDSGHKKLFVYPHAARPFIGWDGLFPPSSVTSACFIFADGHADVLRAYGYRRELHTVGWAYTPLLPFVPAGEPSRVLFCPIHPNNNGYLSRMDKHINLKVYELLLDMVREQGIQLTVRHLKNLDANGLKPNARVKFIRGDPKIKNRTGIEENDVIIGHQTLAYNAVAMGKPTVMMAEYEAPRNGGNDHDFKRVRSWEKYKDLLMYPLDILDTTAPYTLLTQACASDTRICNWRTRMIGATTFDEDVFIRAVESYL